MGLFKKHIAQNLLTSVILIECENLEGISSPLMNLSEVKKLYQDNLCKESFPQYHILIKKFAGLYYKCQYRIYCDVKVPELMFSGSL